MENARLASGMEIYYPADLESFRDDQELQKAIKERGISTVGFFQLVRIEEMPERIRVFEDICTFVIVTNRSHKESVEKMLSACGTKNAIIIEMTHGLRCSNRT